MLTNENIRRLQKIDFEINFYRNWIMRFKGDIKKLKNEKRKIVE